MLNYLQKFNTLPQQLRDKVSSLAAVSLITDLEKKYNTSLALAVMMVMTKDLVLENLPDYLHKNLKLDALIAWQLAEDLKSKLFIKAAAYLEMKPAAEPVKKRAAKSKTALPERVSLTEAFEEEDDKTKISTPADGALLVKGASFFFSPEDEEEVRQLAKKIGGFNSAADFSDKIEGTLNNIVASTQINFGSQALAERFRGIVKTYLLGIRNKIETRQSLLKPFEDGGLSFDQDSVDKVLMIVEANLKNNQKPRTDVEIPATPLKPSIKLPVIEAPVLKDLKDAGAADYEYNLAANLARAKEINDKKKAEDNIPLKLDTARELAAPVLKKLAEPKKIVVRKESDENKKISQPIAAKEIEPLKKSAPADSEEAKRIIPQEIKPPLKRRLDILPPTSGKVKMEDVKYAPRVMNPVDELKYMDLINFRRLGSTTETIIRKIREKIDLLEQQSYARRLEGIRAWRANMVNKLYLEMGKESIRNNKPVSVIIEERSKSGREYMTAYEFEAVMDLNKSLRF